MNALACWRRRGALAGAALLATAGIQAQPIPPADTLYRVEVIAFANRNFSPEQELFDATRPDPEMGLPQAPSGRAYFDEMSRLSLLRQIGMQLDSGPDQPPAFPRDFLALETFGADLSETSADVRVLSPDELQLTASYRALGRRAGFQPLLHGGWVQTIPGQADAFEVDIGLLGSRQPQGTIKVYFARQSTEVEVDMRFLPVQSTAPAGNSQAGFFNPFADNSAEPAQPVTSQQPAEQVQSGRDALTGIELPARYSLNERRRVTVDTPRYFDHPAFGLIVLVTEEPEEDEAGGGGAGALPAL